MPSDFRNFLIRLRRVIDFVIINATAAAFPAHPPNQFDNRFNRFEWNNEMHCIHIHSGSREWTIEWACTKIMSILMCSSNTLYTQHIQIHEHAIMLYSFNERTQQIVAIDFMTSATLFAWTKSKKFH